MEHVQTATAPTPFHLPAPPRSASVPQVWAGAVLVLAALFLVALGGCFLIGDLVIANPALFNPCPDPGAPQPIAIWDAADICLFTAVSVGALICFVGAAVVGWLGFLGLYRILFGGARTA
ncbi:MAG TPA: hypothetical protein VMS17_10185 [Gemmataceae bacterium]|nr:hypothetical protein [Gemmataceae bacterium]